MLVRELNRRLGGWQAASVKVQTMAQRLKAAGRSDPSVAEEARALLQAVSGEARRFEDLLTQQSKVVANHGRVTDTQRSFVIIADRLQTSLSLLDAEVE